MLLAILRKRKHWLLNAFEVHIIWLKAFGINYKIKHVPQLPYIKCRRFVTCAMDFQPFFGVLQRSKANP